MAARILIYSFPWALENLLLLSFSQPASIAIMDSLGASFTIEVDRTPIAKIGSAAEDCAQATVGPDAAVFTLKDGKLQSGAWILARPTREDRSFAPKPVRWFKVDAEDTAPRLHPVTAYENGDSYDIKFANAGLTVEDGKVLADLQGTPESNVVVKLV